MAVSNTPEANKSEAHNHKAAAPKGGKPAAAKSGAKRGVKRARRPRRDEGYQVCIHVGPKPEGIAPTARFVEISPSEVFAASRARGVRRRPSRPRRSAR